MDFKGKVAIITGGVQGIGKAISKALLNEGMKIVVCDVNEQAGKLFIEEVQDYLKPNIIFQKCDVSSYENLKDVFVKAKSVFGRIDVVVNNAGITNEAQWKRMIDINFIGVIHGIYLGLEFMGTNKGGSGGVIINTASCAGLQGFDIVPIYAGCKHAVVGLTRSYGTPYHYEKTGVKVSAICPGAVETQLYRDTPKSSVDEEAGLRLQQTLTPTSPEEVAKATVQLLRDGKNGALLSIDHTGVQYEK